MKIRIAVEAEFEIENVFYDTDMMDEEKNIIVSVKDRMRELGGCSFTVNITEHPK